MCGFAGYLGGASLTAPDAEALVAAMADRIRHRGPDDGGVWCDSQVRIAFGHRRLSIVDLSAAGHQPMHSAAGRYVIAYNGEVYNHLSLREQLPGYVWRGHSDTETLLAGFETWGIRQTIERCVGMFAIAVWDLAERTLTLVRDRLGEKPLYFGWQGKGDSRAFLFASELKALQAHPSFVPEIDRGALALLLRHAYVPAPYSIYRGISKLEPGCMLTMSAEHPDLQIQQYWNAVDVARAGRQNSFDGTPEEAVSEVERLSSAAIGLQMVADVPLGAFLSGGVDSSTVVALMQAQASRPVKTFTIGFNEPGYNEAEHASAVARHLGTDHTELYVSAEQAMAVIPSLPRLYCEPFADSSQIPTYLVSQMARQHVTVSLSGDAGDELFAGYNRYQISAWLWGRLSRIPAAARRLMAEGVTSMSPQTWDGLSRLIPGATKYAAFGDKVHKGAAVLGSKSIDELYLGLVSHDRNPEAWVIDAKEPPTVLTGLRPDLDGLEDVERMMALDAISYLPDDILTKVDRAAMSASLETRVPFLDHRVVEFAWRLPISHKLRDGQTKWPLRQVLYRHVPRELIERPKMGFGIPLREWLCGPLREWAESLLEPSRLRAEGYFNVELVRARWAEHLSGRKNWGQHLWTILMFQAWLEDQRK